VKEEDGSIGICVLGQKIWVKGESYELQEIYGMEQNRGVVEGGRLVCSAGLLTHLPAGRLLEGLCCCPACSNANLSLTQAPQKRGEG